MQTNMDETTRLHHRRDSVHSGNIWTERSGLVKLLMLFAVVVMAIAITLSLSLAFSKTAQCRSPDISHTGICETPECVKSAAYIISAMDTSVDPCDDFFSFACRGYFNNTFLLGNRVGRFTKLSTKIILRMKELLEEPLGEDIPEEHWNKTKRFYKSCMDLARRQKLSDKPLKEELKELGGWPLLIDKWNESTFSWVETLKTMFNKGYDKDILMKIEIGLDLKNSSKTLLLVDQPVLTLPKILYDLDYPFDYGLRAYKMFIVKCALLLNGNVNLITTESEVDDAMEIEKLLAEASLSSSERRDFFRLYDNHIITLEELDKKYSSIPWKTLFMNFLPTNVTITDKEEIWVPVPSAIEKLNDILADRNGKRRLANYMMYRMVAMAATDLSHSFLQSFYDFHNVLTGTPYSYPEPWQECVDVTGFYFSYSISSKYSKRYFDMETKNNVSAIEKGIQEVMKNEIRDANWIDDKTGEGALRKAEKMRAVIGYPDDILKDELLNGFYKNLEVGEDHYENVRSASHFLELRGMMGLHEKYDKYKWEEIGNLLMANAFYSPSKNTITIPVGVLQEETFNVAKPNYLNFGSLGMLLGHELTHGFDMSGSQFDEKGDWKFWWSNETYQKLEKRSECFIDQYNSYEVPGTNRTINGTLTLNENMADTGGVRAAYKAYQQWVDKHGREKLLPALPYTPNQLFWLSFASVWCSKETKTHLLHSILLDEHSPPRYRVKGIVSNMEEFSKDFGCKKSSPMNPNNKCSLWE